MFTSDAPADEPVQVDPVEALILTPLEAAADRAARTKRHVSHCIHLAVVTSPEVAGDLIDRAIELTS